MNYSFGRSCSSRGKQYKCNTFKIKDIEKIVTFINSKNLKKILIIGYVELPSIDKINLSIKSKLLISKDIFLNNINDQSKILKKYLSNNKLNLISQKNILKNVNLPKDGIFC